MDVQLAALLRSLLVFLHLVAIASAAVAIAFGDYAIFRARAVDRPLLRRSSRSVVGALLALWVTGLAIFAIDLTTLDPSALRNPKLLAKLSVVVALTSNGWFLHRFALASIGLPSAAPQAAARAAAMLGAFSAVSWGYALFLGVAKVWTPLLGYSGFMVVYGVGLTVGLGVALRWVQPVLVAKCASPVLLLPGPGTR